MTKKQSVASKFPKKSPVVVSVWCVGLLDWRQGLEMLLLLRLRNCYRKVFKLEFLGGGFHSTKYPSKYVDTST